MFSHSYGARVKGRREHVGERIALDVEAKADSQKRHRSMSDLATTSFARMITHGLNRYRDRGFINRLVYSQRR
jgi:hypothetical protein